MTSDLLLLRAEDIPDALLDELDKLIDGALWPELRLPALPAPKNRLLKTIWQSSVTGALFYLLLAAVVVATMLFMNTQSGAGVPRSILGYSAMTVLTRSMQSEIPQGSFVVVRVTDPRALQIGDDITFLRNERTTFTHRIVTIHESYADTGKRGFQTKGVDNAAPDADIVLAGNVIGKVIFHSEPIGRFFNFIKHHLLFSGMVCVLLLGLFMALRMFFSPRREQKKQPERKRNSG